MAHWAFVKAKKLKETLENARKAKIEASNSHNSAIDENTASEETVNEESTNKEEETTSSRL